MYLINHIFSPSIKLFSDNRFVFLRWGASWITRKKKITPRKDSRFHRYIFYTFLNNWFRLRQNNFIRKRTKDRERERERVIFGPKQCVRIFNSLLTAIVKYSFSNFKCYSLIYLPRFTPRHFWYFNICISLQYFLYQQYYLYNE